MRHWLKPVLLGSALLIAVPTACTTTSKPAARAATAKAAAAKAAAAKAAAAPTLVLATRTGVEGVSAADGALRYQAPDGVLSADGQAVFATEGDRLVKRDTRTGTVQLSVAVGSGLVVSTISPDGQSVALTTTRKSSYLPAGRTRTAITVVALPAVVKHYDLAGNFAPDAFSIPGAGGLFLVSYVPPLAPDRYQITWLGLGSGEVSGIFGRQKEALEDMRGVAGTKVLAPDMTTLYTLYLRPPGSPASGADNLRAEVHTLKLDQSWAYCVDLPAGFGGSDLSSSALGVSPDGAHLYVVDRAVRQIEEIDTTALTITRSAKLAFTAGSGPTSLVVGRDGHLYISDGPSIMVVRTDTLSVADRWPMSGPVTGLAVTGGAVADGGQGIVASTPQRVEILAPTGSRQSSTAVPADATSISRIVT